MLTLDDYLLSWGNDGGGDGSGRVNGGDGSGSASDCGWLWLQLMYYFIVIDILFYCDVYIILLC